ncbi:MAG: hypothetical protein QXI90_07435, partial [Thermofilum sp.]
VIFTSFTLKVLKVRCPQCGTEFTLDVTTAVLNEASQSPMGLAGVALPHGDHVLVVYVDSSGGERGLRVFKSFQMPAARQMTEVLVPSDALKGLRNIGGFTIELGKLGLRLTSPAGRAALLLKGRKGDTSIELELVRNLDYQAARPWLEMLLEVIDTSYSIEVADYVNSLRVLDVLLEERPFVYARQVLWLVANSSIVKTRLRMPEAQLVRTLKPSAIFERYGGGFVSRVLESGEARLRELLTAESPQLLLSSAEAILALYRRGAVDLVVT